jgi:hypothetical protein
MSRGVVTEEAREQGRGVGGTRRRVACLFAGDAIRGAPCGWDRIGSDDAVFTLATVLTFSVVGAIVASRHPRNTMGWVFCSVGLVVGLDTLARGYAEFSLASGSDSRSLGETAVWFASWAWTLLVVVPTSFLLLLFPDGRLPSPRWRPMAWWAGLGISGFVVGYALDAGPLVDFPQLVNPYGVFSSV